MFNSNILPCLSKVSCISCPFLFQIKEAELHAITYWVDLKGTRSHVYYLKYSHVALYLGALA